MNTLKLILSVCLILALKTMDGQIINNEFLAIIYLKGIAKETTLLHMTDNHIVYDSAEDTAYEEYTARMNKAHRKVKHYITKEETTPVLSLKEIIDRAIEKNVDVIVSTGDLINYPSKSAVNYVNSQFKRSGKECLYISGNHDWHYEGMKGSANELRDEWINKSLLPLYKGRNPYCYSYLLNGINFVAIDNSTYQVNQKQLDFFIAQKKLGHPIVLLVHIPIYVKDNEGCGNPEWGAAIDENYKVERRERWPETGNLLSTVKFVEEVKKTPGIIVMAGHTHVQSVEIDKQMTQFTGKPSTNGSHKIFKFKPLSD